MKRKRFTNLFGFTLVLSCIFLFGMSLITPYSAYGAKKPRVINIGLIGDYSGPYAPLVGVTRPGTVDAWQYINGELGGVNGVKVKPLLRDMSGKISLGLSMYNEVINTKPKPTFIDIYITPLSEALRERYVEDNTVGFHAGAVVSLYPKANAYAVYPLYPEQVGVVLNWIRKNWKKKRNPRVGIITWDTSYGRAILIDEFYKYLKKIGVDLVETQLFGIRDVDVMAQLMKLRSKKVDFLVTNTAAGGPLTIKKGCKGMGWNVPLINSAGSDWGTVNLSPGLFDGDILFMHTKSFDEKKDKSIKTVMKYYKRNKRTVKEKSIFYFIAWQNALIEHKVMTDIVNKYGWKGLTTKNIKRALNRLKNFAPLKGLTKITYSDDRRTPRVGRVYTIKGTKIMPQTDFMQVPDMRPVKYR